MTSTRTCTRKSYEFDDVANVDEELEQLIVFDALHTGHVIRRMRSGGVRIFNGNQRETL